MQQKLFSLLLFVLSATFLSAQQKTEGIIQFEEKVNMHRRLPADAADMKAMIPEWNVHKSELLFSAAESLYRNVEEEEDEDAGNGQGMVIKIQRPESVFYRNFNTNRKTDSRDFMGKAYLIEDTLRGQNWKLTGETKKILTYNCLKAVWQDTLRNRTIVAWFTDEVPVFSGPHYFANLPGMVLEIDINNGEQIMVATKVEFKKLGKKDIEVPTKGEKTTEQAFDIMVAEKMKAMGGNGGMIKINRN